MRRHAVPAALMAALLSGGAQAEGTRTVSLPVKNCVEDQAIKRQLVEQDKLILAALKEMEPRLNTGPASIAMIREQCDSLFADAEKCAQLGIMN